MNGAMAEFAKMIIKPIIRSKTNIGASHHFFLSIKKRISSFINSITYFAII